MKKQTINSKKAVMIGCGFVGSASVFALMQSGLFTEIVLIDADKDKADGEAMDISPVSYTHLRVLFVSLRRKLNFSISSFIGIISCSASSIVISAFTASVFNRSRSCFNSSRRFSTSSNTIQMCIRDSNIP